LPALNHNQTAVHACSICSYLEIRPEAKYCSQCGRKFDPERVVCGGISKTHAVPIETLLRYYKLGKLGHLVTYAGFHYLDSWGERQKGERIHLQTMMHSIFDWLEEQDSNNAKILAIVGFGPAFRPERRTPKIIYKREMLWLWRKRRYVAHKPENIVGVDILILFDSKLFGKIILPENQAVIDITSYKYSGAKYLLGSDCEGSAWSAKTISGLNLVASSPYELEKVLLSRPILKSCQYPHSYYRELIASDCPMKTAVPDLYQSIMQGVLLAGDFEGLVGNIKPEWKRDEELDIIIKQESRVEALPKSECRCGYCASPSERTC